MLLPRSPEKLAVFLFLIGVQWHPVAHEDALIAVAGSTGRRELADYALDGSEIILENDFWVFGNDMFSDQC